MNTVNWIIALVIAIPAVGLLLWMILDASLVRVRAGRLGLLLVRGRATDITLPPGPHFVPAIRRRTIEEYPSVELTYRAGRSADITDTPLDRSGPAIEVTLGDHATAAVICVIRFRLVPDQLRLVHERFGPDGVFAVVRDTSSRVIAHVLRGQNMTVEAVCGDERDPTEEAVESALRHNFAEDGIGLVRFHIASVDLGRTGEVIQATLRARHDLAREEAEAATRLARAINDGRLQQQLASTSEAAWRYREPELLRDLVHHSQALNLTVRAVGERAANTDSAPAAEAAPKASP